VNKVKGLQRAKAQSIRDKARRMAKNEALAALPDDSRLEERRLRLQQGLPPPAWVAHKLPSVAAFQAASALVAAEVGSHAEAAAEAMAAGAGETASWQLDRDNSRRLHTVL
jgi:hypothetical protein